MIGTLSLALRNLLRNTRRSLATLLALAIGSSAILIFGGFSASIRYSMLTAYVRAGGHLQVQHQDFFLYGGGNPTAYGIANYDAVLQKISQDPVLAEMLTVVTPMLQLGGIAGNYDAGVSRTVVGTGYVAADINAMRKWNEYSVPLDSPNFVLQGAPQDAAIVGLGVARVLLLCEALAIKNCPQPQVEQASKGAAMPADLMALTEAEAKPARTKSKLSASSRTGKPAVPAEPEPVTKGARIELLASLGRGTPNVAALKVLAAEDQGFKEFDEVAVILHLAQAQQLVYGRGTPRATALMVQLKHTADIPAAKARIEALLAASPETRPLAVRNFEELNPFYVQTMDLFDMILGFIFVLIGGIVLFTVGNTMSAAVVERTVEIGTLRAIGLRQAGIRYLFIIEGFVLGVTGAIVGTLAAILLGLAVNQLNLTWLPPGSSERLPLNLRIWGEGNMILGTTVGLIVIAAVSAWWPAWRAARLKIVDALRHA